MSAIDSPAATTPTGASSKSGSKGSSKKKIKRHIKTSAASESSPLDGGSARDKPPVGAVKSTIISSGSEMPTPVTAPSKSSGRSKSSGGGKSRKRAGSPRHHPRRGEPVVPAGTGGASSDVLQDGIQDAHVSSDEVVSGTTVDPDSMSSSTSLDPSTGFVAEVEGRGVRPKHDPQARLPPQRAASDRIGHLKHASVGDRRASEPVNSSDSLFSRDRAQNTVEELLKVVSDGSSESEVKHEEQLREVSLSKQSVSLGGDEVSDTSESTHLQPGPAESESGGGLRRTALNESGCINPVDIALAKSGSNSSRNDSSEVERYDGASLLDQGARPESRDVNLFSARPGVQPGVQPGVRPDEASPAAVNSKPGHQQHGNVFLDSLGAPSDHASDSVSPYSPRIPGGSSPSNSWSPRFESANATLASLPANGRRDSSPRDRGVHGEYLLEHLRSRNNSSSSSVLSEFGGGGGRSRVPSVTASGRGSFLSDTSAHSTGTLNVNANVRNASFAAPRGPSPHSEGRFPASSDGGPEVFGLADSRNDPSSPSHHHVFHHQTALAHDSRWYGQQGHLQHPSSDRRASSPVNSPSASQDLDENRRASDTDAVSAAVAAANSLRQLYGGDVSRDSNDHSVVSTQPRVHQHRWRDAAAATDSSPSPSVWSMTPLLDHLQHPGGGEISPRYQVDAPRRLSAGALAAVSPGLLSPPGAGLAGGALSPQAEPFLPSRSSSAQSDGPMSGSGRLQKYLGAFPPGGQQTRLPREASLQPTDLSVGSAGPHGRQEERMGRHVNSAGGRANMRAHSSENDPGHSGVGGFGSPTFFGSSPFDPASFSETPEFAVTSEDAFRRGRGGDPYVPSASAPPTGAQYGGVAGSAPHHHGSHLTRTHDSQVQYQFASQSVPDTRQTGGQFGLSAADSAARSVADETPSRTLFVRNIKSYVEDDELAALFEPYGPIRSLYTQTRSRGFVMVTYYDLRHARRAIRSLQGKMVRRRSLDIHYSIPKDTSMTDRPYNQGALVVSNLHPHVTGQDLIGLFAPFGVVREVRVSSQHSQRFVEYFDSRDAEAALAGLNNLEILGERLHVEIARSGYQSVSRAVYARWDLDDEDFSAEPDPVVQSRPRHHQSRRLLSNSPGSSGLSSSFSPPQYASAGTSRNSERPNSFHQHRPSYMNVDAMMLSGSPHPDRPLSAPLHLPHQQQPLQRYHHQQQQLQQQAPLFHQQPAHHQYPHHHSAPGGDTMGPLGGEHNLSFGRGGHGTAAPVIETIGGGGPGGGRSRGNRQPSSHFAVDINRIKGGLDKRTTVMVRNIPNKYTQKMLLDTLHEHLGAEVLFDFFYLPIDFKNKCNVGYAFINFIDYLSIVTLYETFNGKRWPRFNSEKVCAVTYGKIQGKQAFITHFENSSLMREDPDCRPLIFYSDGPLRGQPQPFPVHPTHDVAPQAEPTSSSSGGFAQLRT